MGERAINWRRVLAVYGTIFAALLVALVFVEQSGPTANLNAPAPPVDIRTQLVGSSATVVASTTPAVLSGTVAGDCPSGLTMIAKFNFKNGAYAFDKGTKNIVTVAGNNQGGTYSSTQYIFAVVVQ